MNLAISFQTLEDSELKQRTKLARLLSDPSDQSVTSNRCWRWRLCRSVAVCAITYHRTTVSHQSGPLVAEALSHGLLVSALILEVRGWAQPAGIPDEPLISTTAALLTAQSAAGAVGSWSRIRDICPPPWQLPPRTTATRTTVPPTHSREGYFCHLWTSKAYIKDKSKHATDVYSTKSQITINKYVHCSAQLTHNHQCE